MKREIHRVAVVGAGTMGAGIAGICAAAGQDVVLLDMTVEDAQKAVQRLLGGRRPAIDEQAAARIRCGSINDDLASVADCDWICEAIIEDLDAKRALFGKLEQVRKLGSIVTTNTSGIPLRDLYTDMPGNLARDIAVTHFFNPPHIMRLLELIAGTQTDPEVIDTLRDYCGKTLGKGVVNAKDTVNFIGNRIGCFWMLAGLHKARAAMDEGVTMEQVDALMSAPLGLPTTGLYGLVDLIGLDVMNLVGKNLKANLPAGDAGLNYVDFPDAEQAMLDNGQLGRKTGGGFYRLIRHDDGSKNMEVYNLLSSQWRSANPVELDDEHKKYPDIMFADTPMGRFSWNLMSAVLAYAADLVPDISDDIVNIDRAMCWGFSWAQGPFAMIDTMGAQCFANKLSGEGRPLPHMLAKLLDEGADRFYRNGEYFGLDGHYHAVTPE